MPNFGNIPNMPLGGAPPTGVPQFMPPPFPLLSPYMLPPPPMPPSLDRLTDEEIRNLEGTERKHVEERIKVTNAIKYNC